VTYSVVVAGLPQIAFDRVRKESDNRIAPGGKVVLLPNRTTNGYSRQHADDLIARAHAVAASVEESRRFTTLLLYVNFHDASTDQLLERFFPFSLPLSIDLPETQGLSSTRALNEQLNLIATRVIEGAQRLRELSRLISDFTGVANLTPLLLPVTNFRVPAFLEMLQGLYQNVGQSKDPKALIEEAVKRFIAKSPRVYPPGESRHCLSDGRLFFRSPGRDRHGYFRLKAAEAHNPMCLLNARSRIGGSYDYRFHYDCIPTTGRLLASYDNCHGAATLPKERHVNIAPNDFII
jgi:hypothetical protein